MTDSAPARRPRARELHRSATVAIHDYRCNGRDHGTAEEAASEHQLALIRRGAFARCMRGDEVLIDATQAVFFARDEPYRVRHPVGGDACTAFTLREDVLMDLLEGHDPTAREREHSPFRATHAPCDARVHWLHQRLYQRLDAGACEDLLVEEVSIELCDALVRSLPSKRVRKDGPRRASTRREHRELAEASKVVLQRRMSERLVLDDVARSVHSSPYHLARIFRRETGTPLHRHLDRLRLREALARLIDGARDLTALALTVGYGDHSHFTNAFRREFRRAPSQVRSPATARELRELSKNLQV